MEGGTDGGTDGRRRAIWMLSSVRCERQHIGLHRVVCTGCGECMDGCRGRRCCAASAWPDPLWADSLHVTHTTLWIGRLHAAPPSRDRPRCSPIAAADRRAALHRLSAALTHTLSRRPRSAQCRRHSPLTMSKRKPTNSQQDEDTAKKPRAADGEHSTAASTAASASAPAAASSSDDSLDAAIRHADLIPQIAIQTLKLADAIKPAGGNYESRIKALMELLKADADRAESLVDWSLVPPDDEVRPSAHSSISRDSSASLFTHASPC